MPHGLNSDPKDAIKFLNDIYERHSILEETTAAGGYGIVRKIDDYVSP